MIIQIGNIVMGEWEDYHLGAIKKTQNETHYAVVLIWDQYDKNEQLFWGQLRYCNDLYILPPNLTRTQIKEEIDQFLIRIASFDIFV